MYKCTRCGKEVEELPKEMEHLEHFGTVCTREYLVNECSCGGYYQEDEGIEH